MVQDNKFLYFIATKRDKCEDGTHMDYDKLMNLVQLQRTNINS